MKRDYLVLLVLLVLALVSRFYDLSGAPYMVDEWFTVMEAENRMYSFINPLYYLLTFISFELFGVGEWAARFPAALLGVLAPAVLYWLWRNTLGQVTAISIAVLTLLSAWHLDYSQFSRFYSGVFLFGGIAYHAYWQAFRSGSFGSLLWAGLFTLIATAFHLTAFLIAGSVLVYAILVLVSRRWLSEVWDENQLRTSRFVVWIALAVSVVALPLLWSVGSTWLAKTQHYGYGSIGVVFQLVKYIGPVIAVAAGLGLLAMFRKATALSIFFGVVIVVPAFALVIGAAFTYVRPDYVFYSLPVWYALAGYLVAEIFERQPGFLLVKLSLLFVLVTAMLPETLSYYTGRSTLDYRDAIKYLEKAYEPGDIILPFVGGAGLKHYGNKEWDVREGMPYPYNQYARWDKRLEEFTCVANRQWVMVPIRRNPLAKPFRRWLFEHASLKWRVVAKRFDYSVFGYELFLIPRCEGTAQPE